jgi:hypothetical protein
LEKLNKTIVERVKVQQKLLKHAAKQMSRSWDGSLNKKEHFHIFKTQHPQAVMINHFDNIQYFRIFTTAKLREPLTGVNPFEGIAVDMIAAQKYIRPYKRSLQILFSSIHNAIRYNPKDQQNNGYHFIIKCTRIKDAIMGVYRMPK